MVHCLHCSKWMRRDNFEGHFSRKHQRPKSSRALVGQHSAASFQHQSTTSKDVPSTPRRTSVNEILKVLDQHQTPFNQNLLSWIRARNRWYSLDDLSTDAQPDWVGSEPLPRLFPTHEGWHPRPPTHAEVLTAVVKELQGAKKSFRSCDAHEQPSDAVTALVQLQLRPDDDEWIELQQNPVFVINLTTPELSQKVHIPRSLKEKFQFEEKPPLQMTNMTPKFTFVDVHIDHGMEAVSICVGRCRKIWFLWPPTPKNLREMRRLDHRQSDRLIRSYLDHGILLETDGTTGIHVPAGWLHATFTIEAGFLVGITPVVAESIEILSNYTSYELVGNVETNENLRAYLRGLTTALHSTKREVI